MYIYLWARPNTFAKSEQHNKRNKNAFKSTALQFFFIQSFWYDMKIMVEKKSYRQNIAWFLLHTNSTEGSTPSTWTFALCTSFNYKNFDLIFFTFYLPHLGRALHRIHNSMINVWCKMWPLFHCFAHCMRPNVIFDKTFLAIQPALLCFFPHSPPWYSPNWIISYSLNPLFHCRFFVRLCFVVIHGIKNECGFAPTWEWN